MKKRLIILACAAVFAACSTDSTSSTGSYSLQLQFTSTPTVAGSVADCSLQVTRSGVPVTGAKLTITSYPKDTVITSNILSDAAGKWTHLGIVMGVSTQQVAFRAYKDTLSSNYVVYAP
jgi:hypothetical protein